MVVSLGERYVYIKFWNGLSANQRRHLNRVCEDLPLDRAGGLMKVTESLWNDGFTKSVAFTLLVWRMMLNCATTGHAFLLGLHAYSINIEGTTLTREHAKMCQQNLEGHKCISMTLQRFWAYRLLTGGEFAIVALSAICVLACMISFLCGNRRLPSERPFFFFFAPRITATFSSISFLQWLNFARLHSLLSRGEGRWLFTLLWGSLRGSDDTTDAEDTPQEVENELIEKHSIGTVSVRCGLVVIFGVLVFGSFQALLVKLTIFHFAAMKSFYDWTPMEWVTCFGFVNQIAGLAHIIEIEMQRILLLKFGGSSSEWTPVTIHVCVEYFRLVALRIVEGQRFKDSPVRSIMAMSMLDSDDIQKLLISKEREQQLAEGRETRFKLNEDIYISDGSRFADLLALYRARSSDDVHKLANKDVVGTTTHDMGRFEADVIQLQKNFRAANARMKLSEKQKEGYSTLKVRRDRREAKIRSLLMKGAAEVADKPKFSMSTVVKTARIVHSRTSFLRKKRDELLAVNDLQEPSSPRSTKSKVDEPSSMQLLNAATVQEQIEDLENAIKTHFGNDFTEIQNALQSRTASQCARGMCPWNSRPKSGPYEALTQNGQISTSPTVSAPLLQSDAAEGP